MAKQKKLHSPVRPKEPPTLVPSPKNIVYYGKMLLKAFVPLTLLIGIWIYWPRDSRPFVPGIGIEAQCSMVPEIRMTVQVIDDDKYRIALNFGNLSQLGCSQLKIAVPADVINIIQLRGMKNLSAEEIYNSRRPFKDYTLTRTSLHQPILNISTDELRSEPFIIEMTLKGMIPVSFDRFRLLIPTAVVVDGEPKYSKVRVVLDSILILKKFDTIDVSPPASARKLQFGHEILYFDGVVLSEINILLIDRTLETWKSVFNAFALATAMSVLAAGISNSIRKAKM